MLVATAIFAIAAAAAAFGTGYVLGYYASEKAIAGTNAECDKLRSDIESLTQVLTNAAVSLNAIKEENSGLAKRTAGLTRHYLEQTERMRAVEQLRIDAEARSTKLQCEIAVLKDRGRDLAAKIVAQAQVPDIREKLMSEFEIDAIRVPKASSD